MDDAVSSAEVPGTVAPNAGQAPESEAPSAATAAATSLETAAESATETGTETSAATSASAPATAPLESDDLVDGTFAWTLTRATQALQAEGAKGTHLDWLAVARLLQAACPSGEPLGQGLRASDDALKIEHSHRFGFAAREVTKVESPIGEEHRATVVQDAVGLLGPNGPMPYAWTQYLYELSRPDPTDTPARKADGQAPAVRLTSKRAQERGESFLAFINLLQRRHLALFVRAWMETRAEIAFDPFTDAYPHPLTQRLSALAGLPVPRDGHVPAMQATDSIPADFKRAYASVMARRVRSPQPLAAMLGRHLDLPVRVQEFLPRWIQLTPSDRTRLGLSHAGLGTQAMLGDRCWDARQSFRVLLGPMGLSRYREFLPGQAGHERVRDLVATAMGPEWRWELVPLLAHEEIPPARLPKVSAGPPGWAGAEAGVRAVACTEAGAKAGIKDGLGPAALGLTSWLGLPRDTRPASDLRLPMMADLRPRTPHPGSLSDRPG